MTDTALGLMIGVGLSAACGFRVFVPLLGLSLASMTGHLTLSPGFAWIGSQPAVIAFATATALEIAAYCIPWLDHLMDTLITPASIIAGTIVTASLMGDLSPFLKWTLAVIAGGGVAGIIQAGTILTRSASSMMTGGIGNILVSTGEAFLSILTTALALILPIVGLFVAALLCAGFVFKWVRGRRRHT